MYGRTHRLGLAVLCLAGALATSRAGRASSTMELVGATTGGHQITSRVMSHGSAATYFNPSLLPEATPKLEAGVFGLAVHGNIRLNPRPSWADVPDTVYYTEAPGRPLATSDLAEPRGDTGAGNNMAYAAIGLVRPLAGKSLVFGIHAFLPVRGFIDQKGFFADEREQYFSNRLHFELLGDRLGVSSVAFALGSQLDDWLSVGAGIDVAIYTVTKTTVFIPDGGDQSQVLLAPDIHTDSRFRPYFAATVHPNARSSVIATVHLPSENVTRGQNDLRFWNYTYEPGQNAVRQVYTMTQGTEPLRVALGGSLCGRRLPDGRAPWEVGVQLLGQRWSQYHNRQGEHPLDQWRDTVSVAAGAGFLWHERHVSLDLGYVPSPVPAQTGRTNYVDNARLVASAGIEGPVQFLGRELEAGITFFASYFIPRSVDKNMNAPNPVLDELPDGQTDLRTNLPAEGSLGLQTNNPGYPGWKSTGFMVGAGATFRIAR